jgi:hypothetical protein
VSAELVAAAIAAVLDPRPKLVATVEHTPVATFVPGRPVSVLARIPSGALSVRLLYRHLNQAETYHALDMERDDASWRAAVPGAYTQSPYPLQYYFEVRSADGAALWPGFKSDFLGQPYFVSVQA